MSLTWIVYNTYHRNDAELTKRQMLNRKRVEDAFFQYAALRVSSWYPKEIKLLSLKLHSGITGTLQAITSIYHGAFMKQYAGKGDSP